MKNGKLKTTANDKLPTVSDRERTRALNVMVPASVHKRVRVAAAESEMPLKDYIAKILEHAQPVRTKENEQNES